MDSPALGYGIGDGYVDSVRKVLRSALARDVPVREAAAEAQGYLRCLMVALPEPMMQRLIDWLVAENHPL
ncbi:hypothetical protein ACFOD4_04490 [Pseudoroseomonas globiformis]|uniref:Uncharacterized protein n=1 Tax=Teichococcus globiformis TaxID=2307229 RepID=A0ABV7FYQ6_9PROT